MADNEINVNYNTNGVPSELPSSENVNGFSEELSDYLYPKLNNIENIDNNGDVEFSSDELETYGLNESNNKIDISSTKKLIKYLKSYAKKLVDSFSSRLEELDESKLDVSNYVIDDELKDDSSNPVANNVLYQQINDIIQTFDSYANLIHTHDISDINSLSSELSSIRTDLNKKVSGTELANHVTANNPHNITLEKLGVDDYEDNDARKLSSILGAQHVSYTSTPRCRKYGKMVMMTYDGTVKSGVERGKALFILKDEYHPKSKVETTAYRVGTGKTATCNIDANGKVFFGGTLPSNDNVRINVTYMTK